MPDLSPALGGRKQTTGREPGLPRLHQQRYKEMHIHELCLLMDSKQGRLFACACAESALQLMERKPTIYREAINLTRQYARNEITLEDLHALWDGIERELLSGCHGIPYCVGHAILCAMREEIYPYSSAFLELVAAGQFWDKQFYDNVELRQKARAIRYLTGRVK